MKRTLLLLLLVVSCIGVVVAGPARAAGPDVVAWWNVAHAAVPPPAPPDVGPGQLLIQGTPPLQHAVAGLAFTVGAEQIVGALTLEMVEPPPVPPVVKVCRATAPFASVENGPWAAVPPYDCEGEVVATVDGPRLTFVEVGRLVRDGRLAVVVLAVEPTRVVIAAPDNRALDLTDPYAVPIDAMPLDFPAFGPPDPGTQQLAPSEVPFTEFPAQVPVPAPPEPVAQTQLDPAPNPYASAETTRNPFEESSFRTKAASAAVVFALLAPFAFAGRRARPRRSPA